MKWTWGEIFSLEDMFAQPMHVICLDVLWLSIYFKVGLGWSHSPTQAFHSTNSHSPLGDSDRWWDLSQSSQLTLLTCESGVLAPPTAIRPLLLSSNNLPGDLSLRVLRSLPGDFSLSSGRPGDLSLRSSVLPSRYRWGVLGSRGWLEPSGGPGLDATRLVMCSL